VLARKEQSNPRFQQIVRDEQELRAAAGNASYWFQGKNLTKLDGPCRRFIASSPFVVVASSGADGHIDTSPKGDTAGFVQILDDVTLAIPDRPGNRRFDTFKNVLQNPNVGLIFFVPGRRETLRIGGKALIVRDVALRRSMALKRRIPDVAMIVTVERAFFNCGACVARSRLWDAAGQSDALAEINAVPN